MKQQLITTLLLICVFYNIQPLNAQLTSNNCTFTDSNGYYYDLTQLTGEDYTIYPVQSKWASQWKLVYSVCGLSKYCSAVFPDGQGCQFWAPNPSKYIGLSGLASTQTFETLTTSVGEGLILSSRANPKTVGGCQDGVFLNVHFLCSESTPITQPTAVEDPQCTYTVQVPTLSACPFGGSNVHPIPSGTVEIDCQETATGMTVDGQPYTSYECTVINTSSSFQEVALYAYTGEQQLSKVWGQFRPANGETGLGIWYPKNGISPMKPETAAFFGYMTINSTTQIKFLPVSFK
ncbi:hypothetical protein DFA_09212 [Cavenderia fasciculata]|uniref:MRH domain-containing protein n=1 Tax=Cavenderia fasciculata TaxID=261658 RepID=F4Q702_CACFS|nr:uncharacterized protein DFA_09212 [Cavenderia fasciculata]EGG16184.1 hypothetical protein DFA_09212 [Cavenderia fasciculata]|eukprot:XP_004354568.1 hypothetical protein DFA_09212 [Cavenderia fasciculata]